MKELLLGFFVISATLWISAFLHELAHYFVASRLNVKIALVQVGTPAVATFTMNDTKFKLGLFPLTARTAPEKDIETEEPWWKNFLITIAGPLSNLFFGALIVLLIIIFPNLQDSVFSSAVGFLKTLVGTNRSASTTWANSLLLDMAYGAGFCTLNGVWGVIVYLACFFNLAIGAINLIPFPGLDGAGLAILIYRWIFKEKGLKLVTNIHYWGMLAILVFNIVWLVGDFLKIWIITADPIKIMTITNLLKTSV